MKNEQKKEYSTPSMKVVELELQAKLMSSSSKDPQTTYSELI